MRRLVLVTSMGLAAIAAMSARATPERPYETTEKREACRAFTAERRPFFGDTHVHTAYSFDASAQDTRNTPRDAYRFAKGESMGIQPYTEDGEPTRTIRLERPLDFVVVTDHAELLGEVHQCMTEDSGNYWAPFCIVHRNFATLGFQLGAARTLVTKTRWGFCGDAGEICTGAARGVWQEIQAAAEEAYDRSRACRFTSFVGYEYTATVGSGQNLHRNVAFRNERVPEAPVSWVDTPSAIDLWDQLEATCLEGVEGCDVLTIPHNSNLSGGLMFQSAGISKPENFAKRGYAGGVPMGSDLPARPEGAGAPRFAISALKDPGTRATPGTPLQRVQIVKGWLEGDEVQEQVLDVGGGPNDADVDLATCEPSGTGADQLCSVWEDPSFDPDAPAFYYVRVLENPTCRWSQYVCNAAKVDCADLAAVPEGLAACCSEAHHPKQQERAWTSPIWYTP